MTEFCISHGRGDPFYFFLDHYFKIKFKIENSHIVNDYTSSVKKEKKKSKRYF